MYSEGDRAYFDRRLRQERDRAQKAADPVAYRLHTELARQYEIRLSSQYGAQLGQDAA